MMRSCEKYIKTIVISEQSPGNVMVYFLKGVNNMACFLKKLSSLNVNKPFKFCSPEGCK
jgi:hypothetical protein